LNDGVFFTKAGAIKLARYVEQELSRYMSNRVPVALPSGPVEAAPSDAKPAERPLMGPVVPLTGKAKDKDNDSDSLLGAPGTSPIHDDAIATKVLTKGETLAAPAGRADNFAWQNRSQTEAMTDPQAQPKAMPSGTSALALAPDDIRQQKRKKRHGGNLTQQKPARNSTPP
jgi:hypothetical protein